MIKYSDAVGRLGATETNLTAVASDELDAMSESEGDADVEPEPESGNPEALDSDFESTGGDFPEIEALLEQGHIYSESHLIAKYQWVRITTLFRTPQGKTVVPRAAVSGSPAILRRFAPFTIKITKYDIVRVGAHPEIPAESDMEGTLLDHRIITHGSNVTADGQTRTFWVEGVYRHVLDEAKEPESEFAYPGNPAINPEIDPGDVTDDDYILEMVE